MKRSVILLFVIAFSLSISACGDKAAEVAAENIGRVEAEKIARVEAEKKATIAEEGKAKAEAISWGMGIAVIIALLVGVAIGSSAKKDAQKKKEVDE